MKCSDTMDAKLFLSIDVICTQLCKLHFQASIIIKTSFFYIIYQHALNIKEHYPDVKVYNVTKLGVHCTLHTDCPKKYFSLP